MRALSKIDVMDADSVLRQCLMAAGAAPPDARTTPELAAHFVRVARAGPEPLAAALGLKRTMLDQLCNELDRLARMEQAAARDGRPLRPQEAAGLKALTMLRALDWFQTAREAGVMLSLPRFEPLGPEARASMFQQVYAIEEVVKALYGELVGNNLEDIKAHLTRRMGEKAFKDMLRRASSDSPLTGVEFGELIALFVNREDWPRSGKVYENDEEQRVIELLIDKCESVKAFLHDVRRIRNRVAHGKPLSFVHRAMLDAYYPMLIEPVRAALHRDTEVDPAKFEHPSQQAMDAYKTLVRRLDPEFVRLRRLVWASVGAVAVLAVVVGALAAPSLLDRLDPARHEVDAVKKSPELGPDHLIAACSRGDFATARRLSDIPGVAGRMREQVADLAQIQLVQLAATRPERLTPCVPLLKILGWDASQPSRTSVANDMDPANNPPGPQGPPAGYQSYLQVRAKLRQQQLVSPPDPVSMRGTALLYAVWRGDAELVAALVDAGADPAAPLVGGGTTLTAASEASRLANPEVLHALGSTARKQGS